MPEGVLLFFIVPANSSKIANILSAKKLQSAKGCFFKSLLLKQLSLQKIFLRN
jgi:hypothetical protein